MLFAYVGSFSYKGQGGVHICRYEEETGAFSLLESAYPEINAGFVCVRGDLLYATDERAGDPKGFPGDAGGGRIYTFRIDRETGGLTLLAVTPTLGVNPSHVAFDSTGRYAVVTHFSIGPMVTRTVRKEGGGFAAEIVTNDSTTCLFRVNEDGTPGRLCDVYWHKDGHGLFSMIHKAYRFPGKNLFAENDLGADILYFFSIDYEGEKLIYRNSYALSDHGAGPRHGVVHPELPYLYINYERMGAVSRYDVSDLDQIHKAEDANFVPDGMELDRRRDNQSELMFGPDGKTLYSFLRGKGYAIVYDVDGKTGALTQRQFLKLPGSDPRGAVFSPDHRFILIAGHEAGELETLRVLEDGTLEDTGLRTELNDPACIAFYTGGNDK